MFESDWDVINVTVNDELAKFEIDTRLLVTLLNETRLILTDKHFEMRFLTNQLVWPSCWSKISSSDILILVALLFTVSSSNAD